MKVEYRRDLQGSYLVLRAEETADEQTYPLKMVTQNHIRGLLKCECRRIDDDILYYYDLTSKISLAEMCCARKITGEEIVLVVYQFLQLLMNMDEYLLSGDSLWLKPEYIYVDARMQEVNFCYVPGETWNLEEQFRELMEGFLPYLDHKKQEDVLAVYGLYHYAVQESFSVEGLRQQLEIYRRKEAGEEEMEAAVKEEGRNFGSRNEKEIEKELQYVQKKHPEDALHAFLDKEETEEKNTHPVAVTLGTILIFFYLFSGWFIWRNFFDKIWIWIGSGILLGTGVLIWYRRKKSHFQQTEKEETKIDAIKIEKSNTGNENREENRWSVRADSREREEIDEDDEGATRILSAGRGKKGYLLEEKYPELGRQVILGEKEVQFIGYLKGTADLLLPSPAVSRLHARLRRSGDRYYLCDLNSRNGTWVNEQELQGEQEVELKSGDEIKFADLVYRLRQI